MKRLISFQEDSEIIKIIDKAAKAKGINRSGFIRESLRKQLKRVLEEDFEE